MSIHVGTVYNTVQALANKEQRGYLTPQEFNLFANQAQNEIIEQYFYDVNQFDRSNANSTEYSDMVSLLDKKMAVLKAKTTLSINDQGYTYINRSDIHTIGTVCAVPPRSASAYNNNDTVYAAEYDRVDYNEFKKMLASPLTRPTANTPVYYIIDNSIYPYPVVRDIEITYIKKPSKVTWGYVVVNKKAIYNPSTSSNFYLHTLEESELVYKILTFAGITLNKPGLSETAVNLERVKTQQEKS